jgi:predicted Zn-dependent protease
MLAQTTIEIQELGQDQYAQRLAAELSARPRIQFARLPFVKFAVARQKVADGSANFDDRLAMILHNARIQQWDELLKQVEAIEKLATDKPGTRWLQTILLATIRRNEEARQRLLAEAKQLAAKPQQDETYLARFILGQAYSLTGWPEYFEFVQVFEAAVSNQPEGTSPRFVDGETLEGRPNERQPGASAPRLMFQEARLQCLDALGRHEDALALRKWIAETSPWHLHWQTDFANRLARAGQADAAFAWLQKELDRPIERDIYEDETLRSAVCELYRGQGRWADLLKYTTEWIARKPESQSYNSAYAQHLSALVFNDQVDAANALAEQWFREARIAGPLAPDQRARLETAIQFANGSAYNLHYQRAEERWFEELAETIRFFLRHRHHSDIATRGIGNHYFLQSDVADLLRGEFLRLLQMDLPNLTPVQINSLLGWTLSGRIELKEPLNGRKQLDASEVPNDVWKKIAAELKPRWVAAKEAAEKHLLSESLRSIFANRFSDTEHLPFLRERLAAAHPDFQASYASSLFETLLTVKWSDAIEQEAFARLLDLSDATEPADRLVVQIPALYRLVDAMLANRQSLAESQLSDQGEQNKLTRKELAAKKGEFRKTAREQLAARLVTVARAPTSKPNNDTRPDVGVRSTLSLVAWMRIEKAWLDVQLDRNLPQVEELCWQILGEAPPNVEQVSNLPEEDAVEEQGDGQVRNLPHEFFDSLLKQRAFTMVMNLAARRKAEPATISRVLKYIEAGIAHGGDAAATWRNAKYGMLIALDRPDDLERELREWIRADVSTAPWRKSLARLVAERGKIDEAIQLFEACEKDKLLTNSDYQMLADWYLVSNRRAAAERSRIEAFKQMPEHYLSNRLSATTNHWMQPNGSLPTELDEFTLFVVQTLFEKSSQPENYLWQHSQLYGACRDFRLLRMLPDAVLGRSPQQVYQFVQTLQNAALGELRNEAAADEILTRIKQLRTSGTNVAGRLISRTALESGSEATNIQHPDASAFRLRESPLTTTDLRALDLLEAIVERKSSEVLNQPGLHVDACVAALQRAFQREWSAGEPRMMSHFLSQLGSLPNEKLKAEQLRELRELQRLVPLHSRDHLTITTDLCNLLFWNYSQQHVALIEMELVVTNYTQANKGQWPHLDNELLGRYVAMLEGSSHHDVGETLVKHYLAKPENDEQRKWLNDRLMSLYNHALEHDGAVSLGKGRAKLFSAIVALTRQELAAAPDENVRYNLVSRLVTTFDIAWRHQLPATAEAVRKFAFEDMPLLTKLQQKQYSNTVTAPVYLVDKVLGPKFALQYTVERMEQYPQRLEFSWNNSWNTFGAELARRRHESAQAKLDIQELEPRVLKLAIAELKQELRTGESRNHQLYYKHAGYFWGEKADDFAKAAEDVLAERRTSGRRAVAVANYLWSGLDRGARAIEILMIGHKGGLLDEPAQLQLVNWLHGLNRWPESIPLLEPLNRDWPDNIHYRTLLMIAYHHSQRPEQLAELYHQIDTHFHAGGRWTEGNVAQFARGCSSCNMRQPAAALFNEAIALHQRSNPASGLNDSTLSDLYQNLALSESALGRTKEAVDAASAAIICWDRRLDGRGAALETLKQVLANAKDLNGFVAQLDAESAKTGQDSPILRKAIGQTYQSRNEHAKGIVQLQLAAELQPHDREIHQALIAGYDATQNAVAASQQLHKLIDLHRHDLALYQQLAERLKDNEAEAERATTSIIESSPNEAENHAAMAEFRQKQNRWAEAIPHWERVAELRRLEPTGLLKLTEAQLHEKRWDDARKSIDKLQKSEWPARFNDIANQSRRLQEQLPK